MSYDSEFQVWTQGYTIAQGGQSRFERSPQNTPFLKTYKFNYIMVLGNCKKRNEARWSFTLFPFVIRYIVMKWESKCFRKYITKISLDNF